MYQDALTALRRLHLKPKDAVVYLACLRASDGLFVHELVTQTKLKRSTIDVVLQRLLDMSFATRVKVGSRYKFFAQSPETILFRQEETTEAFRQLLPSLARLRGDTAKTEILFFEGKTGIREIHDDMLLKLKFAEGDEKQVVSFASNTHVMKAFPDIQKKFIDKRIKLGAWYRAIIPTSSVIASEFRTNPKDLREVKSIDEKSFPFKVIFEVYADSVMIFSPIHPFGGIVIRNEKIADSMRALFYLVWNLIGEEKV